MIADFSNPWYANVAVWIGGIAIMIWFCHAAFGFISHILGFLRQISAPTPSVNVERAVVAVSQERQRTNPLHEDISGFAATQLTKEALKRKW